MNDAIPKPASGPQPHNPADGPAKPWFTREASRLIRDNKLDRARKILMDANERFPGEGAIAWRLADICFREGKPQEARTWIEHGLKTPKTCNARFHCAAARLGHGMGDEVLRTRMLKTGIEKWPLDPELNFLVGRKLADNNELENAARHLEIAVNLKPRYAAAMTSYGYVLERIGEHERAEKVLRQAVDLSPRDVNAHVNLGNSLYSLERFDEALATYRAAMKLAPRTFLFANMAALFRRRYQFDAARRYNQIAQVIEPANAGFIYNLGNFLKEVGELKASCREYRKALYLDPQNGSYHWNMSLALLADGDLDGGFREYEWRWRYSNFPSRQRNFSQPQWDGRPLPGQTLLVHAEQGIGDHLQFARFIPMIVERAGPDARVVLECHKEILGLFEHFADQVELVERLHPPADFDVQLPLLSAPFALGVRDWSTLPAPRAFLAPPAGFSFNIPELDRSQFNVGIIWGGNPKFSGDFERSAKLDYYLPLLKIDGVRLFSLQKGAREPELADAPPEIVRLSDRITDFRDTASIMTQLDMVITTCTSTAHLAGALGVPTWVVLSHNPDWRWLRDRDDSPWYPSARLFRQTRPGDWNGVFDRVEAGLREQVTAR